MANYYVFDNLAAYVIGIGNNLYKAESFVEDFQKISSGGISNETHFAFKMHFFKLFKVWNFSRVERLNRIYWTE